MSELLRDLALDRRSPIPLYYQLREVFRERLGRGALGLGDPFPTEAEIRRVTGLSRMTIRHALAELKTQGLIEGGRGTGTTVCASAVRQLVEADEMTRGRLALRSFTETFRGAGRRVGGRVLSRSLGAPPEGARRELGLGPADLALEVRRVRYLDDEAVSLETSYYPAAVAGLLLETDLDDRSVYEVWGRAGVVPEEAVETIELSLMTPYEAKILSAPSGVPVALYRRTTFDHAGRAIEFTKVVYRGDKHKFTSRLRRPALTPARPEAEAMGGG